MLLDEFDERIKTGEIFDPALHGSRLVALQVSRLVALHASRLVAAQEDCLPEVR